MPEPLGARSDGAQGVMVIDARGRVLGWDEGLSGLLAGEPAGGAEAHASARGESRAVTAELARAGLAQLDCDEQAGPRRFQFAGGPRERALDVTAMRLLGDDRMVLLVARSASGADAKDAGRRLRVFTLGPTRVEPPDASIGSDWLDRREGQLLKLLVCCRDEVVQTDRIAEALWPRATLATANTVQQVVHALRARLEPTRIKRTGSEFIVTRQGGYALNRETVELDIDLFSELIRTGRRALAAGDRAAALDDLSAAVQLYHGDFLAEERYAEWALRERDRFRTLMEHALRSLIDLYLEREDVPAASACLERLAAMEPLDSDVHRQLIILLLRQRRKSRAVRTYHLFRQRLEDRLRQRPDFALVDLLDAEP